MTEPTYYTPSIEEFHVGFHYEWRWENEDEWEQAEIKDGSQIDDIHLSKYQLRVKHLDHDDIVECGWGVIGDKIYSLKNFDLSINEDGGINIFEHYDLGNGLDFTILNKSELKFIMKRLNITS